MDLQAWRYHRPRIEREGEKRALLQRTIKTIALGDPRIANSIANSIAESESEKGHDLRKR